MKPALLLAAAAFLVSGAASAAPRDVIPSKSEITFAVTEMGVNVQGKFSTFDAKVNLDPAKPETSSAEVTVEIASLTTGNPEADEVALDKPWLDKLDFPKATFKSTGVKATGKDAYEVKGSLSLRGKSRDITLPIKTQTQADGSTTVTGQLNLRRTDFGIGGGEWNQSDVVANEVPVKFRLTLAPAK